MLFNENFFTCPDKTVHGAAIQETFHTMFFFVKPPQGLITETISVQFSPLHNKAESMPEMSHHNRNTKNNT